MRIWEFKSELWLPRPPKEVFSFFSDAGNLDALTPAWLKFKILSPMPITIREGALIDYQIKIRGVPVRWRTRINIWEPPFRFVDEQLRGPYRLWIHEHQFIERDGGTLATDQVRYAVPFDFLIHRLLVEPDINKIFQFRSDALRKRFPAS